MGCVLTRACFDRRRTLTIYGIQTSETGTGAAYLCYPSDMLGGGGQGAQRADPRVCFPAWRIAFWQRWLHRGGWLYYEPVIALLWRICARGGPLHVRQRCGHLEMSTEERRGVLRGVYAAEGDEGDDVLPVHRPEPVLHTPRSRGAVICHEAEDAHKECPGVEDKVRGGGYAIEIRVGVERVGEVPDLVGKGPFWDGAVDERPLRPRVVAIWGVAEEMGSEVERARRAEGPDEARVLRQLGVQRSGHLAGHVCVYLAFRLLANDDVILSLLELTDGVASRHHRARTSLPRSVCRSCIACSALIGFADFKC